MGTTNDNEEGGAAIVIPWVTIRLSWSFRRAPPLLLPLFGYRCHANHTLWSSKLLQRSLQLRCCKFALRERAGVRKRRQTDRRSRQTFSKYVGTNYFIYPHLEQNIKAVGQVIFNMWMTRRNTECVEHWTSSTYLWLLEPPTTIHLPHTRNDTSRKHTTHTSRHRHRHRRHRRRRSPASFVPTTRAWRARRPTQQHRNSLLLLFCRSSPVLINN